LVRSDSLLHGNLPRQQSVGLLIALEYLSSFVWKTPNLDKSHIKKINLMNIWDMNSAIPITALQKQWTFGFLMVKICCTQYKNIMSINCHYLSFWRAVIGIAEFMSQMFIRLIFFIWDLYMYIHITQRIKVMIIGLS
jgi:hypothetical protein